MSKENIFINFYSSLKPESPLVKDILKKEYNNITGFHYNPAGGEKYGTCSSARLQDNNYSLEEAFLALWKISFCSLENEPYVKWEIEKADSIIKFYYSENFTYWNKIKGEGLEPIKWLRAQSEHCINAMNTISKPLNLPSYLPNGINPPNNKVEEGFKLNLENLEFAIDSNLKLLLSDAWNETEALFLYKGYWYLLSWGTSA